MGSRGELLPTKKHGTSDSIKSRGFSDQLSNYQLLKEDSSLWRIE
jgi:hypothetical protein